MMFEGLGGDAVFISPGYVCRPTPHQRAFCSRLVRTQVSSISVEDESLKTRGIWRPQGNLDGLLRFAAAPCSDASGAQTLGSCLRPSGRFPNKTFCVRKGSTSRPQRWKYNFPEKNTEKGPYHGQPGFANFAGFDAGPFKFCLHLQLACVMSRSYVIVTIELQYIR